ncbi:MAG TPA: hypothetical protein VI685_12685 [Candidatus Angelobacter sp.]
MRTRATSIALFVCVIAAVILCTAFFPHPIVVVGDKARPFSSLTAEERDKLPDNTQVTLKSRGAVSLGALRAQHRATLERFANAASLGKAVGGKTVMMAHGNQPTGASNRGLNRNTELAFAPPPDSDLVPLKPPTYQGSIPKDYVDFCAAAKATACLYIPPNTYFENASATEGPNHFVWSIDYLISDPGVCAYDGGVLFNDTFEESTYCRFYYPFNLTINFKPTGPLQTGAHCPAPINDPLDYTVDPKGAVKIDSSNPGGKHTPSTPKTCIVKVWITNQKLLNPGVLAKPGR